MSLGPFRLEPVFLSKIWAAPEIAGPLGPLLGAPPRTGEVWLASDRHQVTKVAQGEPAGLGLDQVVRRWPRELLGQGGDGGGDGGGGQEDGQGFPLLIKILSVGDWLSVQVHPDDQAARRLENEPWGKSEAWLVLAAEPGAEIVMGLKPGADRAAVEAALAAGRLGEVLAKVPAREGEVFHLPAGTVHATGPGLTIFEIQQASDVTYRFYDWDRLGEDGKPRELHQEKALEVMQVSGPGAATPPRELAAGDNRCQLLVEDPHFALIKAELGRPYRPWFAAPALRLIFALAGQGALAWPGGQAALRAGQCWCLPHSLEEVEIQPEVGLTILESVALAA